MFCRFGHVYHNLQNRLTKTLIHAFLDPAKSFTQHYGAVQGISALGPSAVEPNQCKLILCLSHADCICCLQIRLLLLPTSWHICNFWSQNCNLRSRKWDENEGSLACLWCLAGQFRALTQFILLYFGWATKGKLSFLPLGCIFRCAAGKCAGAWCWGMLGRRIRKPVISWGHYMRSSVKPSSRLSNHQRYPCLCRKWTHRLGGILICAVQVGMYCWILGIVPGWVV